MHKKLKISDASGITNENEVQYACIKYCPVKKIIEIGGKLKNFEFICKVAEYFNENINDIEPSFYQKVSIRYKFENMTIIDFTTRINKIKESNWFTVETLKTLKRLM